MNACVACKAGLACATKRVTYVFYCSRCKHWYAYGVGGITIEITNRSVCKLSPAPQFTRDEKRERMIYHASRAYYDHDDICVDCAIKESRRKREKQA